MAEEEEEQHLSPSFSFCPSTIFTPLLSLSLFFFLTFRSPVDSAAASAPQLLLQCCSRLRSSVRLEGVSEEQKARLAGRDLGVCACAYKCVCLSVHVQQNEGRLKGEHISFSISLFFDSSSDFCSLQVASVCHCCKNCARRESAGPIRDD